MNIVYIDPQSYNNLADYDKYLLENIPVQKSFICSGNMPYQNIKNTEIIRNYNYHTKKSILKVVSYIVSCLKLIKLLKKNEYDVIHFQWFKIPFIDYLFLKKIKRILPNSKIVFTAHNVLPHDSGSKFRNAYKKIYSIVTKIIVHAEITKKEIANDFGCPLSKITVIPHGFLYSKYKHENKQNENILTFSFIGYLSNYKGLDILLDAWCGCPEILENKNCRLIIAGAGNLDCLKRIPSEKNIILENYFHTEEELSKIVFNTDVAILPYRKISQSGVLLTYLSEHIPVVVSNIGGLTQPFEIAKIGYILDSLSSDCIKEVLLNIVKNPSNLYKMRNDEEIWKKIDEFYDWKNIGVKTLSLYNENI